MIELKHNIRVRYAECDSMGFVHHSVYAVYFEEARTECMRKIGLNYKEMENEGFIMPVRLMNITYKLAAFYDDVLTITLKITKLPLVKFEIDYEIHNQHGVQLTEANMILFIANKETLKPMKMPKKFLDIMQPLING